ncbi:preprotein translocase [Candidatus Saccharibacteria bacterium]|nr:MAG: preprotein translocase [Candidatus Saccharibacteria bacterium]
MKLVDTHCHIHDPEFFPEIRQQVYQRAVDEDVYMLTVGTSQPSSAQAVEFVADHDFASAIVGVHPHDSKDGWGNINQLAGREKVVGIGEIGLDYFYEHSPRAIQRQALEAQLQIARDHNLPVSFHVRDEKSASGAVWQDFWPIFDNFSGIRGVLHSFTDTQVQLDRGFERGLYVGINGIATFTRDKAQQKLYSSVDSRKILIETDAPYLTPAPFRGTMNEPKFVGVVAEFLAAQRNVPSDEICAITTANAKHLYQI